jgi:hypothetical protein
MHVPTACTTGTHRAVMKKFVAPTTLEDSASTLSSNVKFGLEVE